MTVHWKSFQDFHQNFAILWNAIVVSTLTLSSTSESARSVKTLVPISFFFIYGYRPEQFCYLSSINYFVYIDMLKLHFIWTDDTVIKIFHFLIWLKTERSKRINPEVRKKLWSINVDLNRNSYDLFRTLRYLSGILTKSSDQRHYARSF